MLGKVALMVAQDEGSTFAHLAFEGEDRQGGINVLLTVQVTGLQKD